MKYIKGSDISKYIGDERYAIYDLRSKDDYIKGHICTSKNVSIPEEIITDKNEKIKIIYCEHGGNSYKTAQIIKKETGKDVIVLYGGIASFNGRLCKGEGRKY